MSAFDDLQNIFEDQEPSPVWSRLNPEVGPPFSFGDGAEDLGLALSLPGLEVVFVFDGEGRLLGAYNWKE